MVFGDVQANKCIMTYTLKNFSGLQPLTIDDIDNMIANLSQLNTHAHSSGAAGDGLNLSSKRFGTQYEQFIWFSDGGIVVSDADSTYNDDAACEYGGYIAPALPHKTDMLKLE